MRSHHLKVVQGEEAGREITIPAEGGRLGRSSKNDIVLIDPMLSRHHCRLFFKDGGLWIADLGSANETIVNDSAIIESAIVRGDRITIGDTVLEVVDDGRPAGTPIASTPVDLGFNAERKTKAASRRIGIGPLVTILCVVAAAAIAIFIVKGMDKPSVNPIPVVTEKPEKDMTLTVNYEKVEASPQNIFYYHLELSPDGLIAINIDDLENNRSVTSDKKQVKPELISGLADLILQSGFFSLDPEYEGVNSRVFEQRTISITIGKETHQVRVSNRTEPDIFSMVREKLEDFGRVELGLWAIQFSTEKLLELSNDAYLLGKKLYAERMIDLANLANAITSFNEAEWYLETVEEKPDYFADIIASRKTCVDELNERFEEQRFRAERAIRLREWETAAAELRLLVELIPDREDPRNIQARKDIIEVDAQLEAME